MVRRFGRATGLVLASAALLLAAIAPVAARVDGGCPPGAGWEPFQVLSADGSVRVTEWLAAYRTNQRAIDEGVYTAEELEETLRTRDRNANGWICVKDVNAFTGGKGQGFTYWVNAVDDNAAPN